MKKRRKKQPKGTRIVAAEPTAEIGGHQLPPMLDALAVKRYLDSIYAHEKTHQAYEMGFRPANLDDEIGD